MTQRNVPSLARHCLAVLAAAATFPLVFVGGTVTSKNAGMAVPDWPLSFGSVNPPGWWRTEYVNIEHGHRLLGATVGFLVLSLAIWTAVSEPRKGLRIFAYALLAGVIVQGVLGGLRVIWSSTPLALVHGVTAQLFFAATVIMAVVTSSGWPKLSPVRGTGILPVNPPQETPEATAPYSSRLALATALAVIVQLILGATIRHAGVTVVPHVLWSLMVMALIHASLGRVLTSHRDVPQLKVPAVAAAILVVFQMGLGIVAWAATTGLENRQTANFIQWAAPTLHVATGAIILACTAVMAVVSYRVTESAIRCPSPLPTAPLSSP